MSETGKVNKFIIIMLVLVCIAGIWAVKKNSSDDTADAADGAGSDFSLNVTEKIDMERTVSYGLPVMIDFGADSCIPCKKMAPVLASLNSELRGRAVIRFVDVWKYGSLAQGFPVRVIPTQIFIDSEGGHYQPSENIMSKISFQNAVIKGVKYTFHEGGLEEEDVRLILDDMGMK